MTTKIPKGYIPEYGAVRCWGDINPEPIDFKFYTDGTITKNDVLFAKDAVEREDEKGTYDFVLVSDNKYIDGTKGSVTIH